jgi:hypothetical protein
MGQGPDRIKKRTLLAGAVMALAATAAAVLVPLGWVGLAKESCLSMITKVTS